MRVRRWRAVLLSMLWLVWAFPSRAESTARIIVIAPAVDHPLVLQIGAELNALGFDPILEATSRPMDRAALERRADATEAVAAFQLIELSGGIELWVSDRTTGKTLLRVVEHPPGDKVTMSRVVAVRAVELLRASLIELALPTLARERAEATEPVRTLAGTHPDRSSEQPRAVTATPSTRDDAIAPEADTGASGARTRWFAAARGRMIVAGATAVSSGGVESVPSALVGYERALWKSVTLDTFVLLPLRAARVSEPEGSSTVEVRLLAIAVSMSGDAGPARIGGGVGLGGVWLHAEGDATPPLRSAVRDIFAAAPFVRVSSVLPRQSLVRARLELSSGLAMPQLGIEFAGREVAEWGAPWAIAALGVEVALP
jgi:hypothetical protein